MVGYSACLLVTIAYSPQCYRIWKTNNVDGLSIYTFLVILIGMVLWIIHAIGTGDTPLVISSSASLIQSAYISYKICLK